MFKLTAIALALAAAVEARRNSMYEVTRGSCEGFADEEVNAGRLLWPKPDTEGDVIGRMNFRQRTPADENEARVNSVWRNLPEGADFSFSVSDDVDCTGSEVASSDVERKGGKKGSYRLSATWDIDLAMAIEDGYSVALLADGSRIGCCNIMDKMRAGDERGDGDAPMGGRMLSEDVID
jgi:hypothetical protein